MVMDRTLTPAQQRHRREEHALLGMGAAAAGLGLGALAVYQGSAARLRKLAATRTWVANDSTLSALLTIPGAETAVQKRFNQPAAIVALTQQPVTPALELSPAAQVAIIYRDEQALAAAVQGGTLNRAVTTIIYDYEHWSYTPLDQQQNSAAYVEAAAAVCHAANLKLVAAPSPNIVQALGQPAGVGVYSAFLALGLAGAAARYADAVVAQAQNLEGDPATYGAWTRAFARQAKVANPYCKIWVTLSGAPNGAPLPSETLYGLMLSVADAVDGYWLYVPLRAEQPPSATSAVSAAQAAQEQSEFNIIGLLQSV